MSWTNIPFVDVDADSPITEQLMVALRDNPDAIANGDPGAPKVQQAGIANAAVGRAQLETSTASGELTQLSPSQVLIGGEYGFYPYTHMTGLPKDGDGDRLGFVVCQQAGSVESTKELNGFTGVSASHIGMTVFQPNQLDLGSNPTCQFTQRFVDASPPYNLGNGDISLFVFVALDANNKVDSYSVATAPPWVYNGKTNVVPDLIVKSGFGHTIKKKQVILGHPPKHPSEGGDPDDYLDWVKNAKRGYVEIGHEMKNADMNDIPHPFSSLHKDLRPVLLDPTSDVVDQLGELHAAGEDIGAMLKSGAIEIRGEDRGCNKPDGVCVHKVRWKNG